ncbi:MAG: pantoate--beta-alanine ligase [Bacteroidetes bacterium]|nr:pantoate--beta-alanine ligase [Bacteroidota bacterium]
MIFCKGISSLNTVLNSKEFRNKSLGFVPTMGALHQGHLSLIRKAKAENDFVVCSIFVNPTQFNNPEDLKLYPRTLDKDAMLLAAENCDILFAPEADEMYPDGLKKESADDYGYFIHVLEGAHRPGHFDGVVTIVRRLFELVNPNKVYFGQKDYQQCLVVRELINRMNANLSFVMCPVVREEDGLAMSSRNVRLSEAERKASLVLSQALFQLSNSWEENSWVDALQASRDLIQKNPLVKLDYLVVCDPNSLKELDSFQPNAIALVAALCGSTRLIDNVIMS